MVAKRLVATALLVAFPTSLLAQSVPPEVAGSPRTLLAARGHAAPAGGGEPVDDSDLKDEETLTELNQIEYEKDSWSAGAAIGLSAIPGGGFGLIYARNKAASVVPFLLSAAGYTLGALYFVGVFNTSKKTVCLYDDVTTSSVNCSYALRGVPDPIKTDMIDNHSIDPNTKTAENPDGIPYYMSGSHYTETTRGDKFNGKKTGIYILAGTYVATTLLGAVWSGLTVSDHNAEIRKNVESTAMAPTPVMGYDGQTGSVGLSWGF